MKKNLLILFFVFLLTVFFLGIKDKIAAQWIWPSFEVYSLSCGGGKNCTSYPLVEDVNVYKSQDFIIIVARVYDVSGVSSVSASIEVPDSDPVEYMEVNGVMKDDGSHFDGSARDGIFGLIIDVSDTSIWDVNATYWINISATDIFGINSAVQSSGVDYYHIKNFIISNATQTAIVEFASDPQTATSGQTVNLSAVLKYVNGPVIAGETIIFKDITTSNPVLIGSDTTDSLGIAGFSYIIPFDASNNIILSAEYAGSGELGPSESQLTISTTSCGISATVNNATICIQTPPTGSEQIDSFSSGSATVTAGSPVVLTATLSDAVGEVIYFRDIAYPYTIGSAVTDINGVATITYNISPATTIGEHTLTAFYNGNPLRGYSADTEEIALNITSPGDCATVNNATVCIQASTSTTPP